MPNTSILPHLEEEADDMPKKFRNIDMENFELTWDGKPFGGTLGDKIFLFPGEVVVMPKYLVNFAAMNLARKIYKRKAFAEFKGTEHEKANANIRFRNPEEEIKLQKLMVADNFPEQQIEIKEETKSEELFVCDKCGMKAKSAFGLQAHMRSHK